MFSNKRVNTIEKKSAAIPGVEDVALNFDKISNVIVRCKKHSEKTAHDDELILIEELRKIKPFSATPGRFHLTFKKVQPSTMCRFDAWKFKQWFSTKKMTFTP